jgi:hypothetical protein
VVSREEIRNQFKVFVAAGYFGDISIYITDFVYTHDTVLFTINEPPNHVTQPYHLFLSHTPYRLMTRYTVQ